MVPFNAPTVVFDGVSPEGFRESFAPTSFDRLISAGTLSPVLIVGHNRSGLPLASVSGGNMSLKKTSDGIRFQAELSDTSHTANDVADAVRRGDLQGVSLSFSVSPGGDRWSIKDGIESRVVTSVATCPELSLTPFPCYDTATVAIRAVANLSTESRARLQRASAIAQDIRSGRKVSAENKALLAQALEHLTAASDHVTTVFNADHPSGNWEGENFGGADGAKGGSGTGASVAGFSSGGDNSGSRSVLSLERDLLRMRGGRRPRWRDSKRAA